MPRLWVVLPVVAYAASLVVWLGAVAPGQPYCDARIYCSGADGIAAGRGYVSESTRRYPPGFPSVISLGVRAGLTAQQSALLINTAAGLAAVVLLFSILCREGVPAHLSAWLATGFAVSPFHLGLVVRLLSEPVAVALVLAAMLSAVRRPWLAGVIAGLAWTVRNSMLSLVGAMLAYYLIHRRWRDALLCAIGLSVGGGWLVVCNWLNWGSVLPYNGAPSDRSIGVVVWRGAVSIVLLFSPLVLVLLCVRPRLPRSPVAIWSALFLAVTVAGSFTWLMVDLNTRLLYPLLWAGVLAIAAHWRTRPCLAFVAGWPLYVSCLTIWKIM